MWMRFLEDSYGLVQILRNMGLKSHGLTCAVLKQGSLGIKDIITWNKASMVRHIWDIARKKDSLWVKWCHQFMLRGKSLWGGQWAADTSWTWKKIVKLKGIAHDFTQYKVGNGKDV